MKSLLTISLLLAFNFCFAQPQWMSFTTANSGLPNDNVQDITIDASGNIWFATYGGVAKFDKQNWTVYNSSNSPLPNDVCYSIAAEGDTIWIGSVFGLCRFDGNSWQVYTNIPYVMSMAFEPNGTKWFGLLADGTFQGGLYKYNDVNWTYYNTLNSGLESNWVTGLSFDNFNNLWLTTSYPAGLVTYDGTNWISYDTTDFGIQTDNIIEVSVAPDNDIWLSTIKGILKFDGINWQQFNMNNSGLINDTIISKITHHQQQSFIGTLRGISIFNDTSWINYTSNNSSLIYNSVRDIEIDLYGNKWIGTAGGISIFNENGVIISIPEISFKNYITIYPNPTVNNLFIDLKENQSYIKVTIFDNIGKEILKQNLKLPENKIYVENISPGIYICNLLINQTSYNFKFVKL